MYIVGYVLVVMCILKFKYHWTTSNLQMHDTFTLVVAPQTGIKPNYTTHANESD
jgi:hypothetical protein